MYETMRHLAVYIGGLVLMFSLASCYENTEPFDPSKLGFEYFPLELGNYWIYQIDSVKYQSDGQIIDSSLAFIKEEVVEILLDINQDTIYRIERFHRASDSTEWKIIDVWAAQKSQTQAIRIEENLKFIKLVFPAVQFSSWDGNIFFDEDILIQSGGEFLQVYKNWNYQIASVGVSEIIDSTEYSDVLIVEQADYETVLERRFAIEKYEKGIGLLYKEMLILDTQCIADCEGMTWEEKAEKGFIVRQTLIDHF
jgi:hypothetical protein